MLRIIPRLDIKGPHLVKGIHLEGLRILGNPAYFAKEYYKQGADELFLVDVVASLYGRNSLVEIIKEASREVFIPITVGGGIRNIEDVTNLLRAGADRVAINSAALQNPHIIKRISEIFGRSTVVGCVEAVFVEGVYRASYDNGRENSGKDVISWIQELQELGVGEISITSVDKEGTGKGFDKDLLNQVIPHIHTSFIFHGGAGHINHILEIASQLEEDAICLASVLHYGTDEVLLSPEIVKKSHIHPLNIDSIKQQLTQAGISCRI